MKNESKIGLFVTLTIFTSFFLSDEIFGQEDDLHSEHVSEILGDQDKHSFFVKDGSLSITRMDLSQLQQSNNNILIPHDSEAVIDGEPTPEFSTILIEGTLNVVKTNDEPLRVQKIVIAPSGRLIIGTETNPISTEVEILFVKSQPGEIGIFVFGDMSVHGNTIFPSFAELTADANPGQTQITVSESLDGWNSGDRILITSPGIREGIEDCTEEAEILKTEGVFIVLKDPLSCFHSGGFLENDEFTNSHVASLTRNVKLESEDPDERGSVNFFFESTGYIKYAQFETMGPKNILGRYPIHFHHMLDSSRGMEIVGNSIIDSENRWITIHNSNGIIVKDNVGYKSVGHGFFLEDGLEFDNVFDNNIGVKTVGGRLIPSDRAGAVFWITNPLNSYTNNVAVEGHYYGFKFVIPNIKTQTPTHEKINLRALPNTEFDKNETYDNRHAGIRIDRQAVIDPRIDSSTITITNSKMWAKDSTVKNNEGISIHGDYIKVVDSTIHDFPIGISMNGDSITIEDSQIISHNTKKQSQSISGIVIAGKDNIIANSKIQGYVSQNEIISSDIILSNEVLNEGVTSASVIDTTLSDPIPIIFGYPRNVDSYLEVHGYDAPKGPENLPTNFVLKRADYNFVKGNEKQSNFDPTFLAMVEPISGSTIASEEISLRQKQVEFEKEKIVILQNFIITASDWKNGIISDKKFTDSILPLLQSKLIDISNIDTDDFDIEEIKIRSWVKILVGFWLDNLIEDEEFLLTLQYIVEQQIESSSSTYQ